MASGKNKIQAAIKELEKRKLSIGEERDKLVDLIHETQMLVEDCEEAMDNITRAIDALSELV